MLHMFPLSDLSYCAQKGEKQNTFFFKRVNLINCILKVLLKEFIVELIKNVLREFNLTSSVSF